MKKKIFSKTSIWLILFIIVIISGTIFYGVIGAIMAVVLYIGINYIVFWGKALGITGYIFHSFLNRTDLAEKFYKMAINQKNTTTYAIISYGLILLRRGDAENSLKLFERAEKQSGNNILMQKSAITNQGLCYWQKGEIDKAISVILDCIQKFDYLNPDTYATLGYLYILKEDYDKALEYTNKALEDNNSHASSLDNLGQIYYRLGDLDKAKTYFEKAIEIKNSLADSQYYLGIIAEEKNDIELAKKYFEKANSCTITCFNTITKEQVERKYLQYFKND